MQRRGWVAVLIWLLALPLLALPTSAGAAEDPCANQDKLATPGAEQQLVSCESDLSAVALSTKGLSDASDWAPLSSKASKNPPAGAGLQIDGYFPDDSTANKYRNWNHDAQFVIRLPARWNGQLVVTGAPANRRQYSNDFLISDWVLSQGYAFASTDKGNNGLEFYKNGARSAPGQPVQEWHQRVTELTVAARAVLAQRYGRAPERTWMTGISNGGYLTRWQIENRPDLYDGAVDWEGTLFTRDGPNLFTYLPAALRNYPQAEVDPAARERMYAAGFEPGSEVVWADHYGIYWDLTQRIYREAFDPGYDGGTPVAGIPFCRTGGPAGTSTACDADYDYASRPDEVKDAVGSVSLTGRIGKPMLTLHGNLDALLPIRTDSAVYTQMIAAQGKAGLHRFYVVEDGTHVDDRYDLYPTQVRPILPCYREAFLRLTSWVTGGVAPPTSRTVERPAGDDVANTCAGLEAAAATGPAPTGAPPDGAAPPPAAAPPAADRARLPATGVGVALPVAALLLLLAGRALRRRSRGAEEDRTGELSRCGAGTRTG